MTIDNDPIIVTSVHLHDWIELQRLGIRYGLTAHQMLHVAVGLMLSMGIWLHDGREVSYSTPGKLPVVFDPKLWLP